MNDRYTAILSNGDKNVFFSLFFETESYIKLELSYPQHQYYLNMAGLSLSPIIESCTAVYPQNLNIQAKKIARSCLPLYLYDTLCANADQNESDSS